MLGRSERKGVRGGNSTWGPGWGHGHTCHSLYVIYCPEPLQQSVEFKEICNEKFLIHETQSLRWALHPSCVTPTCHRHIYQAHQIPGPSSDLCLYLQWSKAIMVCCLIKKSFGIRLYLKHPLTANSGSTILTKLYMWDKMQWQCQTGNVPGVFMR